MCGDVEAIRLPNDLSRDKFADLLPRFGGGDRPNLVVVPENTFVSPID